jgi:hypothetical protein
MRILHIAMGMPEFDRAARELGHEVRRAEWSTGEHVRAIDAALADPPDLVFMQLHGAPVNLDGVRKLREAGSLVVEWFGDVRDPLPQCYVNNFPFVSVTACTNYPDVKAMQAMGHDARFLQIGYDELIYRPDGYAMPAPPIVFMGNNYRGRFPLSHAREAMVTRMRAEFGKDFAVYGKGWGPGVKHLNPEQEAATYRGARVAINFDHFDREGFFSDRMLRATACGCLTMNATQATPQQVVDEVRCVMTDGISRTALAISQRNTTSTCHRWHNRIMELEHWVNEHKAKA